MLVYAALKIFICVVGSNPTVLVGSNPTHHHIMFYAQHISHFTHTLSNYLMRVSRLYFYITDTHLAIWAVVIFTYHNTRFTPLCIIVRNMQPFRHTQHSCTTHIYRLFTAKIDIYCDWLSRRYFISTHDSQYTHIRMIYHTYAEYIFYLTDNRYFIYICIDHNWSILPAVHTLLELKD
jgi:hypothetical protein